MNTGIHTNKKFLTAIVGVVFALVFAPVQQAGANIVQGAFIDVFMGNDSASAVEAEVTLGPGESIVELAKVDTPATTSPDGLLTISSIMFNTDVPSEPISGDWEYMGLGVVDFFVVKAGPEWALYQYTNANTDNMRNIGLWDTGDLGDKGLSHVTAYSIAGVVPLPAAVWLFASGLGLLGWLGRRRAVASRGLA